MLWPSSRATTAPTAETAASNRVASKRSTSSPACPATATEGPKRQIQSAGNALTTHLPLPLIRAFYKRALKRAVGLPTDYGLPEPDHKLVEAHPTISSDLLPRLGHGDIAVKPNISEFAGGRAIRFEDGSEEDVDLVIYCTGYKISFPFFDPSLISAPDNEVPLYRRVVSPEHPGLYFIGLLQPLGAIMPLAEAQSEWVADLLEGKVGLPDREEMQRVIAHERERMAKRYVASARHTIQVDFEPYMRVIARERRNGGLLGRLRARRSHELKLGAR